MTVRRDATGGKICEFADEHLAGVGHGLCAVQCQEGLAVERLHGQAVRLFATDEKAIVHDPPLGAGMDAPGRNGERQVAEGDDVEIDARAVGDDLLDGTEGQFRRQADGPCAAARQQFGRFRIVDIDQRPDIVRPAQHREYAVTSPAFLAPSKRFDHSFRNILRKANGCISSRFRVGAALSAAPSAAVLIVRAGA